MPALLYAKPPVTDYLHRPSQTPAALIVIVDTVDAPATRPIPNCEDCEALGRKPATPTEEIPGHDLRPSTFEPNTMATNWGNYTGMFTPLPGLVCIVYHISGYQP